MSISSKLPSSSIEATAPSIQREVVAAIRDHHEVLLEHAIINDLPVFGHFVQRSLGMSFFLTVTVEYCGLPKVP